jgi:long-chain acyl-CoA synthetase
MDNRPWLANYPAGIAANIDENEHTNLVTFIEGVIKKYGKQEAFECFGKSMSFKELDKYAQKFAGYLQSRGLEKGDKIAIMMPNLLQYPIAVIGAIRAGLIIVNTNPLYTSREMKHQFTDSEVKAIVIAENFAANLEKIIGDTTIDVVITTSIGELLGLKGGFINFMVKNVKRAVPKYNLDNTITFKEALSQGSKFKVKPIESHPEDVVVHQYTGGTTGVSKGAMLTNKNILCNISQIQGWMSNTLMDGKEIMLTPLPLYHIFAFTVNFLGMMNFGVKNVLVTNPRDIKSLVKEFTKNKITVVTGVNTLFQALLKNEDFRNLDHSSIKVTVGGGMAVQDVIAEDWEKIVGTKLSEGYGMTEASPVVSVNPIDGTARLGFVGMPLPSTDVRIKKDDGSIGATNEVGEIQVKGPQVMKGYYNKPEATSETIVDGWLNTGDMAYIDEQGYIKIVDRKKDMILVSGFNVYPNEIENTIMQNDKVEEVAAIGIPSEKSGECVKIFVVKKDKSLKEDELIQFCRENMTGYKVPKAVEFVKDLPKSNVGKILRRKLRDNA